VRDGYYAVSISAVFHLTLIALFLGMSAKPVLTTKPILLDFSIIKTEPLARQEAGMVNRSPIGDAGVKGRNIVPSAAQPAETPVSQRPQLPAEEGRSEVRDLSPVPTSAENVSAGQSMPSSTVGNALAPARGGQGTPTASRTGTASGPGDGWTAGSGRVLRIGDGGEGDKAYPFIKEEIGRHMRYPDKAQRMGWQGTVVVDFVVHENGSIHDVRVVQSSGYKVLDDSARDTLSRITFAKKLPEKLAFRYDVQYRLQ
jgi:TonB family protein